MLGVEAAIAIALSAAPVPSAPNPADDEMICVGVGRIWRGAADDIRQISRVPVPAGYRALYFQGGCGSGLIHESLIDWHFAFGNEASATAALAFLEQDHLAHAPAPGAFPGALAQAWRAAQRDLRAAEPLLSGASPDHDRGVRQLGARPRVSRLVALIRAHHRLSFLANQHLRAAEFYGSPALLAKARLYFDAAEAGMTILYRGTPLPAGGPGASLYNYLNLDEGRSNEMRDIAMRLAILKARLSRTPEDIDAAVRIVDANFSPVFRLAAENADRQDDFCDSGEGDGLDPIRAACDEDDDFPDRFIRFWRNQALLDMLMASDPEHYVARPRGPPSPSSGSSYVRSAAGSAVSRDRPYPDSFEFAVSVLERARLDNQSVRTFTGGTDDNLAALHMARADMFARLAASTTGGSARDAAGLLDEALASLQRAERLSPPAERSGRFRQVAELYLPLAERLDRERRVASEGERGDDPAHAREAAYLRNVLEHLDRIIAGEFPPEQIGRERPG